MTHSCPPCMIEKRDRRPRNPTREGMLLASFSFEIDPHAVLGVTAEASLEQIREAYRRKSKTYHPDVGGEEWAFRVLVQSYEMLSTARVMRATRAEPAGRPLQVKATIAVGGLIAVASTEKLNVAGAPPTTLADPLSVDSMSIGGPRLTGSEAVWLFGSPPLDGQR